MQQVRSSAGFAETLSRLLAAIERRGLGVFGQIDHAAAAREAGLEMKDETVVLFGNPTAGTPLMRSDPRIGIELPLRILIWDGGDGVSVAFKDPRELAGEYEVHEHSETLEKMASLLSDLAHEAAGQSRPAST